MFIPFHASTVHRLDGCWEDQIIALVPGLDGSWIGQSRLPASPHFHYLSKLSSTTSASLPSVACSQKQRQFSGSLDLGMIHPQSQHQDQPTVLPRQMQCLSSDCYRGYTIGGSHGHKFSEPQCMCLLKQLYYFFQKLFATLFYFYIFLLHLYAYTLS